MQFIEYWMSEKSLSKMIVLQSYGGSVDHFQDGKHFNKHTDRSKAFLGSSLEKNKQNFEN